MRLLDAIFKMKPGDKFEWLGTDYVYMDQNMALREKSGSLMAASPGNLNVTGKIISKPKTRDEMKELFTETFRNADFITPEIIEKMADIFLPLSEKPDFCKIDAEKEKLAEIIKERGGLSKPARYCGVCNKECKNRHHDGKDCRGFEPGLEPEEKPVPETVFYFEKPEDIKKGQEQAAADTSEIVQGSRVEIYENHPYEYAIRKFNGSKIYDHIPKSWIKQKPAPEPESEKVLTICEWEIAEPNAYPLTLVNNPAETQRIYAKLRRLTFEFAHNNGRLERDLELMLLVDAFKAPCVNIDDWARRINHELKNLKPLKAE